MLSTGAFNALLKTLEEPPSHAIFILATTDPQKIPATILSRCQRFDFKRVPSKTIFDRLKYIVGQENIELKANNETLINIEDGALDYISKLANGGVRNAISLLDTCLGYSSTIGLRDVSEILGTPDYTTMFVFTEFLQYKNEASALMLIEKLHNNGKDLKSFITNYLEFLTDIRKYQLIESLDLIKISSLYLEDLNKAKNYDIVGILIDILELNNAMKYESNLKPIIEGSVMKLCL